MTSHAQVNPPRVRMKRATQSIDDIRLSACGFERCMQCGRCTASCPVAYMYEEYRPRDVMRKLQMGDTDALMQLVWKCGQCYSCSARCPRNNSVALGVLAVREASIAQGQAPEQIMSVIRMIRKNLYERGETFLPYMFDFLDEFGPRTYARCSDNDKKRIRLGFDSEDARAQRIPEESMAEIRMIMEMTGYSGRGPNE
ncbi:MAG TPA: 4Fe-4S dicluster domain-containing protein [Methanocellaceae archaeon]